MDFLFLRKEMDICFLNISIYVTRFSCKHASHYLSHLWVDLSEAYEFDELFFDRCVRSFSLKVC